MVHSFLFKTDSIMWWINSSTVDKMQQPILKQYWAGYLYKLHIETMQITLISCPFPQHRTHDSSPLPNRQIVINFRFSELDFLFAWRSYFKIRISLSFTEYLSSAFHLAVSHFMNYFTFHYDLFILENSTVTRRTFHESNLFDDKESWTSKKTNR